MFSGWISKWKINRPINEHEKNEGLSRKKDVTVELDHTSVVAYNSTYMEIVDRAYRQRGGWYTSVCLLTLIGINILVIVEAINTFFSSKEILYVEYLYLMLVLTTLSISCTCWFVVLRKDFFNHTYYPIRFNRKTRMVYVYREERDGGILRLPWNEGFYHIGHGLADKGIIDLRCHVMDGETVKDTFAIGLYFHTSEEERIRGLWEQIRTYMDDGAKAAKPDFIYLSMKPTWKDIYLGVGAKFHAYNLVLHILFAPLMYPLIVTRWLVMKTCKQPNWPEDIERACKVEKDDPQELPLPEYYCQLAVEHYDEHNLW